MAALNLKGDQVSDVPEKVHEISDPALSIIPSSFLEGGEIEEEEEGSGRRGKSRKMDMMMVIGHRGSGVNLLHSSHSPPHLKENSILSFNYAGKFNLPLIEFDVQILGDRMYIAAVNNILQVTKDDYPVIFHDDFIFTKDMQDEILEKRVTDLTLSEFLSYGPQRDPANVGKPMFRKMKDGRISEWKVEMDDHLCTLEQVFECVEHSLGFNIELKFDNNIVYKEHELVRVIQQVFQVVFRYAKERPIIFSSFQPDAALLLRKLQNSYPVFFITNGGLEIYADIRRNSLDEAIKLCREGNLNGIVSEVRAILRNPGAITKIKEHSKLSLITYGQLNNMPKVVYVQHLMGIDGIIVDLIEEITAAVLEFGNSVNENLHIEDIQKSMSPKCCQYDNPSLLKLIADLIQL